MSQKQQRNQPRVQIRFTIDSSSKETADKLSSKRFSESVRKDSKYISRKAPA